MRWLHITQDDHGFWMLSLEEHDGGMTLLEHQAVHPEHLIENALLRVFGSEEKRPNLPDAQILIDPPRLPALTAAGSWPREYACPAPRKALE
jgi:hypothetical protein